MSAPALIVYIPMSVGGSLTYYGSSEAEWEEIYRIRAVLPLLQSFHAWKAADMPALSEDEIRRGHKFNTLAEFKQFMFDCFGVK